MGEKRMNLIVFAGWFLISAYGQDQTHNYLLEDRKNHIYIAVTLDEPLPYKVGTWGKFVIEAECESITTTEEIPGNRLTNVQSKFCNSNKIRILGCTNGVYLNGRIHC